MTKCYYGDAFVINGKGLVVFGCGKTRVITDKVILKDDKNNYRICNDSICFDECDGKLYVVPDPLQGFSAKFNLPEPNIKNGHVVDYMFYLNFPEEQKKVRELDIDEFVQVSEFNINYPMFGNNNLDRTNEMKNLIKNKNIRLFSIPWCDIDDDRARIIKNILYNDLV